MARKKTPREAEQARSLLAGRLKVIRTERFGEKGAAELARALGVPARTWYNYEGGVTVPAEVLLRFIERTGVEPAWLPHGRGGRYRGDAAGTALAPHVAGVGPAIELVRQIAEWLDGGRLAIDVTWRISEERGRG